MKARIYILDCLTNLHVGSGESNFNIIDNEVERDVLTGSPVINASSVKGALREYFERVLKVEPAVQEHPETDQNQKESQTNPVVKDIFGGEGNDTSPGKLRFLAAELLALARPGQGNQLFELAVPESSFRELQTKAKAFGVAFDFKELPDFCKDLDLSHVKSVSDKEFRTFTFSLPVLTRNKLEDGTSKHVWHEEVVPHKSLFFLPVFSEDEVAMTEFDKRFKEGTIVQFGGNASIGYGLCQVKKVYGGAANGQE